MGSTILVGDDISLGREMLKALDDAGVDVRACLWFYHAPASEYRFVVAMRGIDEKGPLWGYGRVDAPLRNAGLFDRFQSDRIVVKDANDPLIKAVRSMIRSAKPSNGMRITNSYVNGEYIEDAYIYRSM